MMANVHTRSARHTAAATLAVSALLVAGTQSFAGPASAVAHTTTVLVYDNFAKGGGYTLADYSKKWTNSFGPLEMADGHDTRNFARNAFHVSAAPFRTAADFSVFDHLKYFAASNQSFPVPTVGSVEISSTITAATPGTTANRTITGMYTLPGRAWSGDSIEPQKAGAVMNVVDFSTGQLFD